MKLLINDIRDMLLRNGRLHAQFAEEGLAEPDFIPVVKLFTPDAGCTWLLSELDPECPDIAFGICDLGMGYPECGSVSITELQGLRGRFGLPVERDLYFAPVHTLTVYAEAARIAGAVTEDPHALTQAAAKLAAGRAEGGAS